MQKKRHFLAFMLTTLIIITIFNFTIPVEHEVFAQMPTVDIPTVTSTPSGPKVTVSLNGGEEQVNVRSGPGTTYDKVGVLLVGQEAVAKGKSDGGSWILIEYAGGPHGEAWIYASLVSLSPGELPIVAPPPTPTPLVTPTINPTLAAQFVMTSEPTRLPTYTEPAPLVIPTFTDSSIGSQTGIPMGLVIIILGIIGMFLGIFSFMQRR
jgi:hypothetical protein